MAQFKNMPPLFDTIQQLHDILIPLNDGMPGGQQLKVSIARACEKCWSDEWEGAENLITQLLPFLLLAALSVSSLDADVKRVFHLRGALLLLDFDDPSIESIKGLVLRCLIHPAFMRSSEGRRFLSFLFTVSQGTWIDIKPITLPLAFLPLNRQ
jgi:condensin-2 complex subunit G2